MLKIPEIKRFFGRNKIQVKISGVILSSKMRSVKVSKN